MATSNSGQQIAGGPLKNNTEGGKDDFELFLSSEEDPDSQSEGEEQATANKALNSNKAPARKMPERNPSDSDSMSEGSPRSSSDEEDFEKTGQNKQAQFDKNNNKVGFPTADGNKQNFQQQPQNPAAVAAQPQNFPQPPQANKDLQQQYQQRQLQQQQAQGQPQQNMPGFNHPQMRPQQMPGQAPSMPNYQQMMQQQAQQQRPQQPYQQQQQRQQQQQQLLQQQQRMQQLQNQQGQPPYQGQNPQAYQQMLQQQQFLQRQQMQQRQNAMQQQPQQNPGYPPNMNNPMQRPEQQQPGQYGMPQNRSMPPNFGQQRPGGDPNNWPHASNPMADSKDGAAGKDAQSFRHGPNGQQNAQQQDKPGAQINPNVPKEQIKSQGGIVDQMGNPIIANQMSGQSQLDANKRRMPGDQQQARPEGMQPGGPQEDFEAKRRRMIAGGISPYDSGSESWAQKGQPAQPNTQTQPQPTNPQNPQFNQQRPKTPNYGQYGRSQPNATADDDSTSMDNMSDVDQGMTSPGGSPLKPCALCDKAFEGKNARTSRIQHMVSHFKDRLYVDMKDREAPFSCPMTDCTFQGKNKNGWACHYGSVHGLLKKYEQQYMQQNNLRDTTSPDVPKTDANTTAPQPNIQTQQPGVYGNNPQLAQRGQPGFANPNAVQANAKPGAAWNPSAANPQAPWNNVPGGKPPGWNNGAYDPRNPNRVPQTPMKGGPAPWNTAQQTPAVKPGFTVPNVPVKPERSVAAPTVTATTASAVAPQVQPQATPTTTGTSANMQEATVYKLTMPGSNLEGEQFFVELQAYANLREERDRLNQSNATIKEEKDRLSQSNQTLLANKSSTTPETSALSAYLDGLKETLTTKKEGEDTHAQDQKFLIVAQDIVKQNKAHPSIVELSKKILRQEEEKNSAKVDGGYMRSMSDKIQEVEEQNKQLNANNASVKQAYANLTNESREKLETALNEVEKANQVEKSMFKKIQQLEENNRQLSEVTHTIKNANDEMSNKSVDSRQKLEIALQEVTAANEKEKILSLKVQKLEEANRELKAMHASVKQANIELNAESREKLEIALNEVKKANAIEKALKREKKEFEIQLENNKQIINQLQNETQNYRMRYQNVDEKINQLHNENSQMKERLQDGGDSSDMREKCKEIISKSQIRAAEISQLKMVNERISRENEMWSKKIEKAEESNSKNEKLENALEEAKKANAANKLHLKGMAEKIQKLTGINKQLQEINASVKKENSDLSIKNKEELEGKLNDAKKETEESRNALKSMTDKTLKLTESCKELQKINASVKQANADLIVKSKEKLEIALNEVKKANADQKAMAEKVSELEDSNKQLQEFAKRLKAQKPSGDTKKELETSKKVVSSLNEQLSNMRKKIIDQSSKIKELEKDNEKAVEEMENVSNYKKKYQDSQTHNKSKSDEISQLKLTIDRMSRENTKLAENDKDGKPQDRKSQETIKNYEQQIIALQKKCMSTKEELKEREKSYLEKLAKIEVKNAQKSSSNDFEESDMKQENTELKKLVKHLEAQMVNQKGGKDDGSKDGKNDAKMKHLMETVARKDRELANAKVETAKFQALMKKDLEKIKKMSLQYQPNPNGEAAMKQVKTQLEASQKENQKYKMKLKTLMLEGQKVRETKSTTPAPEDKSSEDKMLSDPRRELRTVRPVGKLETLTKPKSDIKPFEDNQNRKKARMERRTSEESNTERMDMDHSDDRNNNMDTSQGEEEPKTTSDEKTEDKAKKSEAHDEKSKEKNDGKLSEENKIKPKTNTNSMEEELKNKSEIKSIEDKLKNGKMINISPKSIKLVKLEKLTTSDSIAKTMQIESELKNKAASEDEAKKVTLSKKGTSKEKEEKNKVQGHDDKNEENEDDEKEKPVTRGSKSSVEKLSKKEDKPIRNSKRVPVLRKSGRLIVKAEDVKDDKKEDGETDKEEGKKSQSKGGKG